MHILVGHTGFVGSNLSNQHHFDLEFNSSNYMQAFGTKPDLCVYAGVRAEKFLAAKDPAADLKVIEQAIQNIKQINPQQLVLISTIDVYPNPVGVNEDSPIIEDQSKVYGYHRRLLEKWVQENIKNYLIIRLPALFGKNLKKNFIYDVINPVPSLLSAELYTDFVSREPGLQEFYNLQDNRFYKCTADKDNKQKLKPVFESLGFSSLNFTDSRASFQFYNLEYLWGHIETARQNGLSLVNLMVEPVSVSEIYQKARGKVFINEISSNVARYDGRCKHAGIFNGAKGYIFQKEQVMEEISDFIREEDRRL